MSLNGFSNPTYSISTVVSAPDKLALKEEQILKRFSSGFDESAIRAQIKVDIDAYFKEDMGIGDFKKDFRPEASQFRENIRDAVDAIMRSATSRKTVDPDIAIKNALHDLKNSPYVIAQVGGSKSTDITSTVDSLDTENKDEEYKKIAAILADNSLSQADKMSKISTIASANLSTTTVNADGVISENKSEEQEKVVQEVETEAEKLIRMRKENEKLTAELATVKGQMKKYGPGLIRLSLASHPTEIPNYLRQKFRNRGVSRLSGDIYAQLYHLSDGKFRRFISQKKRQANAPALCDALIRKNELIANDPGAIPAKTIIAERRLVVLKQIKEMIAHIKTVDAKNILAGK